MSGQYRYYDSPDGEDFFKKEYFMLRRAFPFGCYMGWLDVLAWSKPVGVVPVTIRFLNTISKPMIFASLFNVTVFMSTRLRGKDDPINYIFGVYASAWYMQRFFPSPSVFVWAAPCALVAFGVKQYSLWYPTWSFFREPSTHRENRDNTIFADFYSYLLLSAKEKNWITLEEAIKRGVVNSKEEAKEKRITNYKDGQARGLVRTGDGTENTFVIC